jgi:two-component system heavy metal sensor histidine kinase CusS
MTRFHTLRGRLTALALLAALVAVTCLTVAFNLVLGASLDGDANSRLRAQAAAAATTVTVEAGRIHTAESPNDAALDQQVWIFDGARPVERPPAPAAVQRAAAALAGRADVYQDVPGGQLRLYAAPVERGGRQIGTIVTGQSLSAYERTTDLAEIGSIALALVLLAAVGGVTWLVIGRALAPVREMTRSATDWSEHGSERRFGHTPRPDELGELAHTFDALLDRVAASLRHEQRLSSELSHELRTPLARIVAEVELLQRRERPPDERREALAAIGRSADQMRGILDILMAAARAEAGLDQGRSDVRDVLDELRLTWTPAMADRGVTLDVEQVEGPVVAGVDAEVVERIVTPLLENASRFARAHVGLGVTRTAGRVTVTVRDDGPGVPPDAAERVFVPGVRVNGHAGEHPGTGLGLALSRRLARAAGGDVRAEARAAGTGAVFLVELPG